MIPHPPTALFAVFAFLLGTVIGSFLNVVIHRLPRGESLIRPGSHCPSCGTPIPFWINVPLLSYLWLRGRCRTCGHAIDLRYPLVELAAGLLFASLALRWGGTPRLVADWILGAVLIAVAFIDGEHRIIPDPLTLPFIPVGVGLAAALPPPALLDSLAGLGFGGGMLWLLSRTYEWRTGRIGLGMGDVKLVAMLGAYLGMLGVLGVLVVGSMIGLLQGMWVLVRGGGTRKTAIPFGPALAAAGLLHLYAPLWLFELRLPVPWA